MHWIGQVRASWKGLCATPHVLIKIGLSAIGEVMLLLAVTKDNVVHNSRPLSRSPLRMLIPMLRRISGAESTHWIVLRLLGNRGQTSVSALSFQTRIHFLASKEAAESTVRCIRWLHSMSSSGWPLLFDSFCTKSRWVPLSKGDIAS